MDAADIMEAGGALNAFQPAAPATYTRPIGERFQGVRDLLDFVPYAQHAAMRDGTTTYDASVALNAGLPGVTNVDFAHYTVALEDSLVLSGRKLLKGNRANLKPNFADPGDAIFKNATNATLIMAIEGMVSSGPSAIVDMQLTGVQNQGLALAMRNCEYRGQGSVDGLGTTPAAGTCVVRGRQIDFINVEDVRAYDYDELAHIDSDKTSSERDNTQIRFKSLYGSRINQGMFLGEIDKAQIEGVDIMSCGSGYFLKGGNKRIVFTTSHVENFGKTGYDARPLGASLNGFGYYFPEDSIQEQILLDHCSVFANAGENALRGVFQGRSGTSAVDLIMRQSYVAPTSAVAVGYKALEIYQGLRWEGYWNFASSEVILGDGGTTNRFMDLAIHELGWRAKAASKNLLPGDRAINLNKTSGGAVSIADNSSDDFPDGDLVTMASGSELYEIIYLTPGWYTFIMTGEPVTGTPAASVRDDPTVANRRMLNPFNAPTTYERMFRMPFRIDTAGNVRVGFRALSGAASFKAGRVALVRNHWHDTNFPSLERHVPAIETLPTAAARYMGQTMQLVKLGATDDEFYVCIQVSGGGYAWKRISVV
jgi:hypothetical protein